MHLIPKLCFIFIFIWDWDCLYSYILLLIEVKYQNKILSFSMHYYFFL